MLTFDQRYFQELVTSPYYQFQAVLREEWRYSIWRRLEIADGEGRTVRHDDRPPDEDRDRRPEPVPPDHRPGAAGDPPRHQPARRHEPPADDRDQSQRQVHPRRAAPRARRGRPGVLVLPPRAAPGPGDPAGPLHAGAGAGARAGVAGRAARACCRRPGRWWRCCRRDGRGGRADGVLGGAGARPRLAPRRELVRRDGPLRSDAAHPGRDRLPVPGEDVRVRDADGAAAAGARGVHDPVLGVLPGALVRAVPAGHGRGAGARPAGRRALAGGAAAGGRVPWC